MKLAIIIVDYANSPDTKECLDSLQNLKWQGEKEIIVVRNTPEKNLGFAQANNQAVEQALKNGADLIMLLNNDTKVDPNLAVNLASGMEKVGFYTPLA